MLNRWHAEDREVILHQLGTDPARGLAPAESSRRLREHGPNLLREPPRSSAELPLLGQLRDSVSLALLLAAALAGHLGHWPDCVVIAAIAVLNAYLGYYQENHAARPLASLARLNAPSTRVVRGGKSFLIPAGELVTGDLVEVAAGVTVAADMRLFYASSLFVDESPLTGQPLPVGKDPALVLPEGASLADRANMLFAGTIVTSGSGKAIVIATGMRTEVGRIARLFAEVRREPTPLRRRLTELGQTLALCGLTAGAAAAAAARLHGTPLAAFLASLVGLLVAVVPAGLPAVTLAALTLGARRLGARGIKVSYLPAAETLGAVTVVGVGKTGTLTRNEMTVREAYIEDRTLTVSGSGYAPEGAIRLGRQRADAEAWEALGIALRIAALCSSSRLEKTDEGAWRVVGDPTEGALLAFAAKGGIRREDIAADHPVSVVFPFSAERSRMTVVVIGRGGRPLALTKGAPDVVLAHCLHHRTPAGVRPLSPADREHILNQAEQMSSRALRVLGMAYREDAYGTESRTVERNLVWVGLAGMLDPPRPEVPDAVAACRAAGIGTVIITGDHKLTALAAAREIGALRPGDEAIDGDELDQLTPEALGVCVERYRVYARVTAEHKLRIIRAWKRRGHLIAMTGDRINDAPALREADIGVALGQDGSTVARETAAVVIADGSFAAIVAAVAEGRGIHEHIRRSIAFLLSGNAAATLLLLAAALAGMHPPLLPVQLLWVFLALALPPALALAIGKPDPALMQEGPHGTRERLLGRMTTLRLIIEGAAVGGAAFAVFALAWRGGAGDLAQARTQALAVLVIALLGRSLACRSRTHSLLSIRAFSDMRLLGAVALSGALLAASVQLPLVGRVFQTVPLGRPEWLRVGLLAAGALAALEALRAFLNSRDSD